MKKIILACLMTFGFMTTAQSIPMNQSFFWVAHVTYINFNGNVVYRSIVTDTLGSCQQQYNSALQQAGPNPISASSCHKFYLAVTP